MISIPIAVNRPTFKWQASLWWWNHVKTYSFDAGQKGLLIVIDKNLAQESYQENHWYQKIPHVEAVGVWKTPISNLKDMNLAVPLNIQIGVKKILDRFDDDQILEICDCDMFHFKKHHPIDISDDQLIVSDIYENWHLKSLTDNKHIINIYFENQGRYYNGGFVPIIGRVKTFKKIIYEWEAVHRDILKRSYNDFINWWAGMFALQAACEKAKVTMIAKDWCYIPEANFLTEDHYIGHYSVDKRFDKRLFPNIDVNRFLENSFYQRIREWYQTEYLTSIQ